MDRYIIILLFVCGIAIAELSSADKAYIDQNQQKMVAQVNANLNTQVNKINEDMQIRFDEAKRELENSIAEEFSGTLKAVAVGLGGIIVITLALFRIIELRLTHNSRIAKYEAELKRNIEELKAYRKRLDEYKLQLEVGMIQTQPPQPEKKKFRLPMFKISALLLLCVLIAVVIYRLT